MLLQNVNAWLTNSDDYQAGLALLRETGFKSAFTLSILESGDDAYNRTRLETELRKWAMLNPSEWITVTIPQLREMVKPAENVLPVVDDIIPGVKQNSAKAEKPVGVLDIEQRIGSLMDGRSDAKASLRALEHLGNDEAACAQRLPFAQTVKQNTRMIDELYSQLDFFGEHGYLPPLATDPALVVDETAELLNMRSYVSRYRGKLRKKNLTPEQRQSYTDLLNQYTAEKERLERKLKAKL